MTAFVAGALMAGYLVVALFFLRFRRESGDRLFTAFAAAFLLLAVQRFALFYYTEEAGVWLYTLRLIAFLLILYAIIDKNAKASRAG
jgi:peptidoglycan/LPS O-acetylase OafA/YrhL